jgi:hypothetical protein
MRPIIRVFSLLLAVASFAHSQDEDTAVSREAITVPPDTPTTARILGNIPDGTPPPPSAPKPEYRIQKRDIIDTTTHEQRGRTITIQKIKPIDLPPPPQPARVSAEVTEEFNQRLAEYQEAHPRSGLMFIGATVYHSKDQPPRTLIRIWPEGGGKSIELWSSADMALIAGGINSFEDSAGNTHHLMIAWSNLYIDRLADLYATKGREYTPPEMPEFTEGKATFQVTGDCKPSAEDLAAIQSLHDLYNSEHARLLTAWQGREKARLEQEAYLKAHPPQPKDITLNYWRTEKSASKGKGAAR